MAWGKKGKGAKGAKGGVKGGKGGKGSKGGKGGKGGGWVFVPAAPAGGNANGKGFKRKSPGGRPVVGKKFGGRAVVSKFAKKSAKLAKPVNKNQKILDKLATIDLSEKVWIGGLGQDFSWKKLQQFVTEQVGKPKVTHVYPKGTACVAMEDAGQVASAIAALNGSELAGKTLEVDVWTQIDKTDRVKKDRVKKPKGKKKVIKTAVVKKKGKGQPKGKAASPVDEKMKAKLKEIDPTLKVWVGGLSEGTTWQKLKAHFTEGECKPNLVEIMKKGSAVLTYDTADEVASAVAAMNGSKVGGTGKDLEVDVWTRPERKSKKEAA